MNKWPLKEYVSSFVLAASIFITLSVYLFLRRGYYDLYIANKVFAGVAFILLALVLSLGTLSRIYQIFDQFVQHRKELGMTSLFFVILHSSVSFFLLPDRFPLDYFQSHAGTFLFGIIGTFVIVILFMISLQAVKSKIDPKKWWYMQNWGIRIVGIATLLHVLPMKYNGWVLWYTQGGSTELLRPYMPPAGLLVTSFGIYVFFVRLTEVLAKQKALFIIPYFGYIYIAFLGFTFAWGFAR